MAAHVHRMPFGAAVRDGGRGVDFRLWAPAAQRVELVLGDGRVAGAPRGADGWHEVGVDEAADGTRYRWRIDGETLVPDPASRCNPEGPHGASEVVDPAAFDWDEGWNGRPWHEVVLYELHVGCFTRQGTYEAAEADLGALVALGVTAIELMPLASFPGRHGWGYDGVLPYAPHAAYGTPAQLKHFVQAAHRHGLMVFVDVVYNHFGPDGNWLHRYAPQFFTERHATPWGAAINYDGDGAATVREFFIHNALYWIDEFRVDGLRLDAVHQIVDDGAPHVLDELSRRVRTASVGRHVHLVLENERNDAARLGPPATPGRYDAQWSDDFHHAMHVLLSGERDGYYAAFAERPVEQLARALVAGFARERPATGAPFRPATGDVPLTRCVIALQNHDQVGNRAFGERIDAIADPALMPAALACVLLAPQVPMLFMGQEYAASTPFLFFCDFAPELAAAVREGRRDEFGRFAAFRSAQARDAIPDPNEPGTFSASRLRWSERETPPHRERLALVRHLLAARRALLPKLGRIRHGGRWHVTRPAASSAVRDAMLCVRWSVDGGDPETLVLHVNFGAAPAEVDTGAAEVAFSHAIGPGSASDRFTLARGAVLVALERGHG
jgi:malto-oligosyltrehalose trehalohydrolase